MVQVIYKQLIFALAVITPLSKGFSINGQSISDFMASAKNNVLGDIRMDLNKESNNLESKLDSEYNNVSDLDDSLDSSLDTESYSQKNSIEEDVKQRLSEYGIN
jgi:hypothetical protein